MAAYVDLSAANAILKEDYLGPLREQLNVATPVLDRLVKNTRDIVGKEAWIPARMAMPQGAGARAENGTLPTAVVGEYKEIKSSLKHYYGALQVTGPTMRQTSKGDKGSFGRMIDIEAKGMKDLLGLVLAHDFYMGHKLADCGVTDASTTVVLASDANMNYFYKGMVVDIITTSTGVAISNGDSVTISSVNKTAKTIVISGAGVTTTSSHSVVREDTYGACVTPLSDIIDATTDIYSVTTSSYADWKSTEDAAVGELTELKMQLHLDKILIECGKFPTAIFCDFAMQRTYWNLLASNKQYCNPEPPKLLAGGFRSLAYAGGGAPIPIIADRLAPSQLMFFVHEPDIQVFTPQDWEFIEIGGDAWLPDILGSTPKDNWKAVLYRDMELGAFRRNSHGKMTGITEVSTS